MAYLENVRTFVRAVELGNMSAAGRDLRISAAVASSRINDLENYLGVRLLNRTTRALSATEQGRVFYENALRILDAVQEAESSLTTSTKSPRGTLFVAAPLGLGKYLLAPLLPKFIQKYPDLNVRLRLSDRKIDVVTEGLDLAFVVGELEDSELRVRKICELKRVLCASPSYISSYGKPNNGKELIEKKHNCLLLRYPGANEFFWRLLVEGVPTRFDVGGRLECDDGDALTAWALADCGIINKPYFEVEKHLTSGALVEVAEQTPPTSTPFSCVFLHRRLKDSKTQIFLDFVTTEILKVLT